MSEGLGAELVSVHFGGGVSQPRISWLKTSIWTSPDGPSGIAGASPCVCGVRLVSWEQDDWGVLAFGSLSVPSVVSAPPAAAPCASPGSLQCPYSVPTVSLLSFSLDCPKV